MAHQLRIIARINPLDDVAADFMTNTWYCDGGQVGATPGDVALDFFSRLQTFYSGVDQWMAHELHNGINLRAYNLADAEPRVPVAETDLTITVPATQGLPAECCAVLSFHGAFASGTNKARRRGRVYIGPLNTGAITATNNRILLKALCYTDIKNAAAALMGANNIDAAWAVYSKTTQDGGATLADSTNDVVGGWVDNAVDIQRRRGVKPTVRLGFGTDA